MYPLGIERIWSFHFGFASRGFDPIVQSDNVTIQDYTPLRERGTVVGAHRFVSILLDAKKTTVDVQFFCDTNTLHCLLQASTVLLHATMTEATVDEAAEAADPEIIRLLQTEEAKRCPQCTVITTKIDGCNYIQCTICDTEWCWECAGIKETQCTDRSHNSHS